MGISVLVGNFDMTFLGRYDRLAFRYVSYVAIPLLAAYTIYSLIYETHRGWYSFVISTLTSFVYMFGFVSTRSNIIHSWLNLNPHEGSTHPPTDHQLQIEGLSGFNIILLAAI